MSYALIINNTIQATGRIPNAARRLDTQEWVLGLPRASVNLQEATGWFLVVDTPRPPDTDTDTFVRSIELIESVPTVVWTQRPWSPEELIAKVEVTNRSAIQTNLAQDMIDIQAIIDLTNTEINSNPATHIKTISRMLRRLGRFALNDLDGTN